MPNNYSFKIIPDFLNNSVRNFPDKIGLVFEEREYSYKKIKEKANSIASYIVKKTKKGDIVALFLENRPEIIFSYFGILSAGRIVLLIPANISDDNFLFQIKKTNPKLIISQKKFEQKLKRTGVLKEDFYTDIDEIPWSSFFAGEEVSGNDVSTIIFTSGTMAEPKGVVLRHCNVISATKNITEFLKWSKYDIDVNILSLSHSFGLGNIHCVLAAGATVILFRDAINIKKIIQTIIEKKATTFAAVPAILRFVVDNYFEEFKKCGEFLRFVQTDTSLMDKELIEKVLSALPNTDFNYYYGLTEASRSTFFSINKHLDKISSIGKALFNVEIKVVDEYGKDLPAGKAGEICIKGGHVIKEYWRCPEASKNIKDGWLKTGDVGFIDKDGYLYFKSRKDDVINVSGEKVSPEEIEEVVRKMPGVKDVAAVGAKDRLLGEAVKLFIVPDASDFDVQSVVQECKKKLESYKVPKLIEVIEKIPRTENGKVRRNILK